MKPSPQPTGNLAGATSDAPQGKVTEPETSAPASRKAEWLEYEVFEHREVEGEIEAIETGGGRTLRAAVKDCKILKRGEGERYDRFRVQRGKFSINA